MPINDDLHVDPTEVILGLQETDYAFQIVEGSLVHHVCYIVHQGKPTTLSFVLRQGNCPVQITSFVIGGWLEEAEAREAIEKCKVEIKFSS